MLPDPETVRAAVQLRQILVGRDYQEVINYAFVDASWEFELVGNKTPVGLKNPLSSQMGVMRSSLLGGLIANLQFNLNRKQTRVRLFEIGCCFKGRQRRNLTRNRKNWLGFAMAMRWPSSGERLHARWIFTMSKPILRHFFGRAPYGRNQHLIRLCTPANRPASAWGKESPVIWGNFIHVGIKNFDLPKSAVLFELDIDVLMARTLPQAAEISKYPPIRRDIAVVVAENIEVQTMLDGMRTDEIFHCFGNFLIRCISWQRSGAQQKKSCIPYVIARY